MSTIVEFFMHNNYGLIPKNFNNHNCIIDNVGALVSLYQNGLAGSICLRTIIGSDVSSTLRTDHYTGSNRNIASIAPVGPCLQLFCLPKWNDANYVAVHADSDGTNEMGYVKYGTLDADGYIDWSNAAMDNDAFNLYDILNNMFWSAATNHSIMSYASTASTQDLQVCRWDIGTNTRYNTKKDTNFFYMPLGAAWTLANGEGGMCAGINDGSGGTIADIVYAPFSHNDGAFGTAVRLMVDSSEATDQVQNVDIAYDPVNEVIGIIVEWWDDSESEMVVEFHHSTDGGANWTLQTVTQGGAADFVGAVSGVQESHITICSGVEGDFIIGYTRLNASGVARPYVQPITTANGGTTYTTGTAVICATAFGKYDDTTNIIGPVFFKAPAEMDINIDPIGKMYVAYQIDEGTLHGTNTPQETVKAIAWGYERLDDTAYPSSSSSFVIDTAGAGEFVIPVYSLGTAQAHQDYYGEGFIGDQTTSYEELFSEYGTSLIFNKYTPRSDIFIAGRTAYEDEFEEHIVKCFFDPTNWTSPSRDLSQADFEDYIDRDLRKLYFPASTYLDVDFENSKGFVANETVWTLEHDGLTYEIRQVLPRFLDGQIIYWEANCYNTGNFDVWSRGGGLS